MQVRSLTEIKRLPIDQVIGGLLADNQEHSRDAGLRLVQEARSFGIGVRDYLRLAVDTRSDPKLAELDGYEAALVKLNLPFKNDFDKGIVLQAASDSFQRFPGTRAMFPEVIDDMLRWQNRQNQFESVKPFIAQSRTISGNEMISTAVLDDSKDRDTFTIPELANIPVRSIRTTQTAVGIFKHGSGYRTSYEFARRASLDILTPYAARVQRELELSKVKAAVSILINGDGVHSAAPSKNQSSFFGYDNGQANKLQYKPLIAWLIKRAQAGVPVDTVIGNYDAYIEWLFMFAPVNVMKSVAEHMQAGLPVPKLAVSVPVGNVDVNFAMASSMPAGKLLGLTKAETLEELVEAGSQIAESETAVRNQSVTYVRTESTGYKLAFGDTREIFVFNEA